MLHTPRSALFVPGDRPDRFDKALAAGADVALIDLEDAVAPPAKDAARESVAQWLQADKPVVVRINALGTPWFEADLALLRLPGVAGVMLPKAEDAAAILRLREAAGRELPVIPLIETAAGFDAAREVATAPGVRCLAFGTVDFQLDLGMDDEGDGLLPFRMQLVLISRLAGIAPPLDGVSTAIDAPDELLAQARRARRLGFGGKLCIHPRQVGHCNAAFSPSDAELDWARRVLAASARAGGAAVAVDGKMVDRPILLQAERLLRAGGQLPEPAPK